MDGIGRAGREWLSLTASSRDAVIHAAFDLPHPVPGDSDQLADAMAIAELGLCEASVIAEPRYRRNAAKAARDADLDRDTIHLAPLWRHADKDETGRPALILPVGADASGHDVPLSLLQWERDQEFAAQISDLVAIPLDGGRALSMTGHTMAVGHFAVDNAKLVLNASPMGWLKAHVARVRAIAADTPAHLVARLHFPPPPPDYLSTLLIEPLALEWRVTSARCVIPMAAREVVVPDSRRLAELINGLMRRKEKVREYPVVRGPKVEAAA